MALRFTPNSSLAGNRLLSVVQGPTGATGATGATGSTGATGAGYTATSVTSNTIASSGSKSFTTQSGLAYTVGARVRATDSANTANWMEGLVTAYSSTTLTFTADLSSGSGTLSSWNINLSGERGATGATGATGPAGSMGGPVSSTDNAVVRFDGTGGTVVQDSVILLDDTTGTLYPATNNSGALGKAAQAWSGLNLASGAQINFGNGEMVVTQSADRLTVTLGDFLASYAGIPILSRNIEDSANVNALVVEGDRATPANGDTANILLRLSDSAGVQTIASRIRWSLTDVTDTSEDATLTFGVVVAGTLTDELVLSGTALAPHAHDGISLGTTALRWSDLNLASGSVISFGPASTDDVTITHASNALTIAGGVVALDAGATIGGAIAKTAGKETIWIPASACKARSTSGAGTSTYDSGSSDVTITTFDFDTASQEYIHTLPIGMPKSWNESTVTAVVYWTNTAGLTTETVRWAIQGLAVSNDDTINGTFGTAVNVDDTWIAQNDLHITAESGAITIGGTPAEDDMVIFQISRDVSGDNLTGDARFIGMKLFITTNAATDA